MKEIKDYTLGEARDICRETRNCSACVFCREDGSCKILGTPNSWDVKNKSWTQKDEEDAKAAMRIFDNGHNTVDWIFAERRDVNGRIHINVARTDISALCRNSMRRFTGRLRGDEASKKRCEGC